MKPHRSAIGRIGLITMTTTETSPTTPLPDWTPRRVILGTLVVLLVVIGFLLVYRFRQVVVIVFSGIVVSMAMAPGVDWLQRRRLPRAVSVILIYLVLLVLLIGFIVLLVPPIVEQLSAAVPQIERYYRDLKVALVNSPLLVIRQIAAQMPAQISLTLASSSATGEAFDAVGQALNTTGVILSGLFTLTAILLIGFYWTLEGEGVLRTVLRPLSNEKRESAREMLQEIGTRVGGYVRGQGILAVAIGVADLIVFLLIGLPAALAVALLAGVFELIPVLGPTLGAIPAVLVAFAYDPSKVVWVIAAGALIQLLENNLLAPRVMHKTVGVNPMVTLLAIVAFGALFGFAGLLLAIPIAAIIQIILDRSLLRPQLSGLAAPAGRDRLSKLRYDAQEFVVDVRNLARHKATGSAESELDPVEDALEAIAMELDQTLAQAAPSEGAA
jgi:predicted PurR-regulated permease PerM